METFFTPSIIFLLAAINLVQLKVCIKSMARVHNVLNETPPKSKLNNKSKKLEYPRGNIVYLGQGAFGVFQAEAPNGQRRVNGGGEYA
ncbi:hypothetical protein GQX74_009676 [Glossina fuscipes]|nr:hypothetical protein GQX74_009676 [Glossina fuscipes]